MNKKRSALTPGNVLGIIIIFVILFGWLAVGSIYLVHNMLGTTPPWQPVSASPHPVNEDSDDGGELFYEESFYEEVFEYAEEPEKRLYNETGDEIFMESEPETVITLVPSALPPFDIVIQAGQSNSMGGGLGEVAEPFEINEDIWYFKNNFTYCEAYEREHQGEKVGNFSLTFAEEYIENGLLEEGRKILILRAAEGGSGFSDSRWGLDDDLYLRMMGMIYAALASNPENRLVALLWHQGETDAVNNVERDEHYYNLMTLVNNVRVTFNTMDLPFVAGDFVPQWKAENEEICKPIAAATRDVCRELNNASFVETYGLRSNDEIFNDGNKSHFNREALYLMGRRYFEAFAGIRERETP